MRSLCYDSRVTRFHHIRHGFRAVLGWTGLAFICLCAGRAAAIESAPISLDDILWKKFQPASEVYIDTTLQFSPAQNSVPDVDVTRDKLALWLNIDTTGATPTTNLCVYASLADLAPAPVKSVGGLRLGARGAVTSTRPHVFKLRDTGTVQPGRWYRLTVRTIRDITRRAAKSGEAARALLGFQIYLDGVLLASCEPSFSQVYTAYAAGSEGWLNSAKEADLLAFLRSGTVFVSLCGESSDDAVGSVGFRGSGSAGDVAVSADVPDFIGLSSLDFTLSFPSGESVVRALLER